MEGGDNIYSAAFISELMMSIFQLFIERMKKDDEKVSEVGPPTDINMVELSPLTSQLFDLLFLNS